MTQPNLYHPTDAANYDSLSRWAGKTEDDWRRELGRRHTSHWTQAERGLGKVRNVGFLMEIATGDEDGNPHDLASFINSLLRHRRPVPAVQGAAVVDTNPNLIFSPNFPTSGTIVSDMDWTWDNSAGRDSVGSAKVVASGYLSELVSNEIDAVEGQKLDLSVWAKWSGLSYTGTDPIVLGVTLYLNHEEVGSEDLASFASPAASQDWTELSYTSYEVPAGCDELRLRLKIGGNLASGSVWFDDAEVIKHQAGSGYIGSLIDRTIQGLENIDDNNWGLDDLLVSMLNQFRTTTDHATRIALLESLNTTGNKINDEFLRTAGTLGANWNVTYTGAGSGTWETDGDYAFWNNAGFADREARGRYIGSPSTTATDTQKIVAILGSKGGNGVFGAHSHVDLYGRMDTGETNWIRARFSSNGDVTITRSLAGVKTDLATAAGWVPIFNPDGPKPVGAGATIILLCGTGSGTRFFEAQINGETVCSTSDSTSNFGASYRGYGAGVKAEGSVLDLGQVKPPKLNAWAAVDN